MSERVRALIVLAAALSGAAAPALAAGQPPISVVAAAPAATESVTFDEAVQRAIMRHPTVGEAAQAILRAQGLLDEARSVFRPLLTGGTSQLVLDAPRGFAGNITQPRSQTAFNATASFPVVAFSRWAEVRQAADQVAIARISSEDVRRDVALSAAEAYLAVITAERQRDIAMRNRDTAKALAEYAHTRLLVGQGSRLNDVRAAQELATNQGFLEAAEVAVRRAQEALGVAIFADGPVDANGDPNIPEPTPPSDPDVWLGRRPDVRLFTAQVHAADRVARDAWKDWLPTVSAAFTPQYVTPKGFFEPAGTWRAFFQLQVPLYDSTIASQKRVAVAERETAQLRLDALTNQARSEVRTAQETVAGSMRVVAANREAAEGAAEALRITEIAYRAGATTNIEVVQAQQTARNTEIALAVSEDRLRQARIDLLVALGEFPR